MNLDKYRYYSDGNIASIIDDENGIQTNYTTNSTGDSVVTKTGTNYAHSYWMSANGYNTNSFTEIINAVTNVTNLVTDKDGRANGSNYTLSDEKTTSNEINYDDLGRVSGRNLFKKNATGTVITNLLTTSYGYSNLPQYKTSNQVYSLNMLNNNGYNKLFSYQYDKLGNITNDSGVTYVYDAAGELTRVEYPDESAIVFTYDLSGNITGKTPYDTNGNPGQTTSYVYDNTWKDKLVTYGGQSITYDNIGNPLSYYNGYTFSWEMGRQLAGVTGNSKTIGYKYNENGIRTQKTVGETTTTYMLNDSGRVDYQTDGTDSLYFRYNSDDTLIGFEYNDGTTTEDYYYVKNLQGDVISILDNTGVEVVSYIYDAWGKLLSTTGTEAATIGVINPFRYRSYYFDTETDLYYLQSRYYDSNTGRFINADVVLNESLFGTNIFAYCDNNPIVYIDPDGYGKIYVFYYDNLGSGFKEQAMNSPYYNKSSKNVVLIAVTSVADFRKAWKNMRGTVDWVYLYLHGGTGVLYFKGESMSISQIEALKYKSVKKRVYLFSCHGGDGKEGNNVAWSFSKLTGTSVIACTGSVSYSNIFGTYFARKAWDWGIIKTFYYQKQYIWWGNVVAKSVWGQW